MVDLQIIPNNSCVVSGKDITGFVLVNASKKLEAKDLYFLFVGKEKTRYKKQSTSGKYFKEYSGKLKFRPIEIELYE